MTERTVPGDAQHRALRLRRLGADRQWQPPPAQADDAARLEEAHAGPQAWQIAGQPDRGITGVDHHQRIRRSGRTGQAFEATKGAMSRALRSRPAAISAIDTGDGVTLVTQALGTPGKAHRFVVATDFDRIHVDISIWRVLRKEGPRIGTEILQKPAELA